MLDKGTMSSLSWLLDNHEAVRNLAIIILGLLAFFLAWKRTNTLSSQHRATEENNINETFRLASENLGREDNEQNPILSVRVGAILSLERLAINNNEYLHATLQLLSAYLNQNAKHLNRSTDSDCGMCFEVICGLLNYGEENKLEFRHVELKGIIISNAISLEANVTGLMLFDCEVYKSQFDSPLGLISKCKVYNSELNFSLDSPVLKNSKFKDCKIFDADLNDVHGDKSEKPIEFINCEMVNLDASLHLCSGVSLESCKIIDGNIFGKEIKKQESFSIN